MTPGCPSKPPRRRRQSRPPRPWRAPARPASTSVRRAPRPYPRWEGQCRSCGAWNSLVETLVQRRHLVAPARAVAQLDCCAGLRGAAGDRFARCEHGATRQSPQRSRQRSTVRSAAGFVPGSVLLLGGEPGIGKSTLVLQIAGRRRLLPSRRSQRRLGPDVLYASAEESAVSAAHLRASRLGVVDGERAGDHVSRPCDHRCRQTVIAAARETAAGHCWSSTRSRP